LTLKEANSVRKNISDGLTTIGVLVSSAAVLNLLSGIGAVQSSDWLGFVLNSYRSLFFPIVENTVGLVPRLFKLQLLDWAKDLIVLYGIVGSAFARSSMEFHKRQGSFSLLAIVLAITTWPLAIYATAKYFLDPGERERAKDVTLTTLKHLAYVIVIVIVAVVLNASGVL
jgi:hypothetical protein